MRRLRVRCASRASSRGSCSTALALSVLLVLWASIGVGQIRYALICGHDVSEGREGPGLSGAAWHTYAIGVLIGAFTERVWGAGANAMPLALVLSVSVTACDPGLGPS